MSTPLEKAEKEYRQALARLDKTRARESAAAKKLMMRRMIVLGQAVLAAATNTEIPTDPGRIFYRWLIAEIVPEGDRAIFDSWDPWPEHEP